MKVESFDINNVRIALFALPSFLLIRKELYHSPENFAEVAGVGGFIRPGPIIQNKHCHRHQYLMLGGKPEMPPTGADPGSVQWEMAQVFLVA